MQNFHAKKKKALRSFEVILHFYICLGIQNKLFFYTKSSIMTLDGCKHLLLHANFLYFT